MAPHNFRILHAEDNADARDLVSTVLGLHNCESVGADTFDKALELAKGGGFHLYLLDTWLPDASGIHLCQRIREFDSKTPILFFSGVALDRVKDSAMMTGAQGYLVKPVDPGALMTEIFRLIEHKTTDVKPAC